jgi:uncharacterized protein (DUF433 family)
MRENRGVLRRLSLPWVRPSAASAPRIVRRRDVWGGKAVIAGTRIPVFMVHARLEAGWAPAEIYSAYPRLTDADLAAVLRYARTFPDRLAEDRSAYERALPSDGVR